jgi:SAM-dependent methyltransferase
VGGLTEPTPEPPAAACDDPGVEETDAQDVWSPLAAEWSVLWGSFADPARRALLRACRVVTGTRVLDVGCGSGELLAQLGSRGAVASGADAAAGMVALARRTAPGADVRVGPAEALPWPDRSVDVVTAVNVLQLKDDPDAALAEAVRVVAPGGLVAVCGWAERHRSEIDAVEAALARDDGETPGPEHPLREEGPVRELMVAAGLVVEHVELVGVPWVAADDTALVRGVLLGEDDAGLAARGPVVVEAARPYRTSEGGYRFRNAFRLVVGRAPRV